MYTLTGPIVKVFLRHCKQQQNNPFFEAKHRVQRITTMATLSNYYSTWKSHDIMRCQEFKRVD